MLLDGKSYAITFTTMLLNLQQYPKGNETVGCKCRLREEVTNLYMVNTCRNYRSSSSTLIFEWTRSSRTLHHKEFYFYLFLNITRQCKILRHQDSFLSIWAENDNCCVSSICKSDPFWDFTSALTRISDSVSCYPSSG